MGEAYERHSLGTRQRFAFVGRADGKCLILPFYLFSYAHPRVGAQRTKSGWHLWIFILDLDQLAFFSFFGSDAGFAIHLEDQIQAGSVSVW